MKTLFDFTPDDGPTETIVVPGVSLALFAELERAAAYDSDDVLNLLAYDQNAGRDTCRVLLFPVSRISNVRQA